MDTCENGQVAGSNIYVSVTHLCIYTETDLLVVVLVQSQSLLISFYFQPIKETLHSEINCLSAQAY